MDLENLKPGDPHYKAYVGPPEQYDFMGATQFRLLCTLGLRSRHKLLDFGCGSLRAGKLFIPYLERRGYCGIEPNSWLIEDSKKNELGEDLFRIKEPRFDHNSEFRVDMFGENFDYIVAQSVFSHAGPGLVKNALANFSRVLDEKGLIVVTFIHGEMDYEQDDWVYPGCVTYRPETVENIIAHAGLFGTEIPWYHPRQTWYVIAKSKNFLPTNAMKMHLYGSVLYEREFAQSIAMQYR